MRADDIIVDVDEWIKVHKIYGNYKCPKCGNILIVISTHGNPILFCIKCNKYFMAKQKSLI